MAKLSKVGVRAVDVAAIVERLLVQPGLARGLKGRLEVRVARVVQVLALAVAVRGVHEAVVEPRQLHSVVGRRTVQHRRVGEVGAGAAAAGHGLSCITGEFALISVTCFGLWHGGCGECKLTGDVVHVQRTNLVGCDLTGGPLGPHGGDGGGEDGDGVEELHCGLC